MTQRPWLVFLTIGVLGSIVLIFFALRLRPVKPDVVTTTTSQTQTITEPTVTFVDPATGASHPKVTLVEFGDFQCDSCKTLSDNLKTALLDFPDTVRLVWKDMPNEEAHPLATKASVAAHCADRQGRFWDYHDTLFDRQASLSETELTQAAADLGLNMDSFASCYNNSDTLPVVRKDYEEGVALHIVATPTFYIGSQSYTGALTVAQIEQLLNQALATK